MVSLHYAIVFDQRNLTKEEILHKLIAIVVVGATAVGLLVAGCGGGGGSADSQQIDKATFVKQANLICEQVSGKIAAEYVSPKYASIIANPSSKTVILIVKEVTIPGLEEELQQIRVLGVPPEAKKETEALLDAYQRVISKIKAKPKAAVNPSLPLTESIELAGTRFGVDECPIAPVNAS